MNNPQNLPSWSNAYWQHRVKEMAEEMIAKKMAMSKCSRDEALKGFRAWILEKTYIRIGSFETLTSDECRTIVSFLHRHRGAFKNTHSHAD